MSSSRSQSRGLVHHVARDEQGRAAVGERAGTSPTGRAAAPGRGPTVGSSSTSSGGSSEERRRERDPRPLAARERGRRPGRRIRPGRPSPITASTRAGADAEHAREVAQVLAHRQVAVHRRRLRDVADPRRAARGDPAGSPSTRDACPTATIWTPTIARISVDLPQPLGPSRPVTAPAGDLEGDARAAPRSPPRFTCRSRTAMAGAASATPGMLTAGDAPRPELEVLSQRLEPERVCACAQNPPMRARRPYSTSNTGLPAAMNGPEQPALGVLEALLVERHVEVGHERRHLVEVVLERDREAVAVGVVREPRVEPELVGRGERGTRSAPGSRRRCRTRPRRTPWRRSGRCATAAAARARSGGGCRASARPASPASAARSRRRGSGRRRAAIAPTSPRRCSRRRAGRGAWRAATSAGVASNMSMSYICASTDRAHGAAELPLPARALRGDPAARAGDRRRQRVRRGRETGRPLRVRPRPRAGRPRRSGRSRAGASCHGDRHGGRPCHPPVVVVGGRTTQLAIRANVN